MNSLKKILLILEGDNKRLQYLVFTIVSLTVFIFEPIQYGFDLGGHLGWVPSHVASQIIKSDLSNYFVGYSLKLANNSEISYVYFDRYPFLFSALTNFVLSPFKNNLSLWVLFSRIWMNLIFIMTLLNSYKIMSYFLADVKKRLAVVLLAFSGFYFVNYKAMVHFDQPAILGMSFLFVAILKFENDGNKRSLTFWSIISALMGRGYANIFILSAYIVMKFILAKGHNFQKLIKLAISTIVPAISICACFLIYNIFIEAKVRNVTYSEVSIVQSARSRIGIDKLNDANEKAIAWVGFSSEQLKRLSIHITPYLLGKKKNLVLSIFFMLIVTYGIYKRKHQAYWPLMLLLAASGFIWLFPMRRLASFHDYTTMYYWGFGLIFYYIIIERLPKPWIVLAASLLLFISSLARHHRKDVTAINQLASDLGRIRTYVVENNLKGKKIFFPQKYDEILPGMPFSMGFYFHDMTLTNKLPDSVLILSNSELNYPLLVKSKTLTLYRNPMGIIEN